MRKYAALPAASFISDGCTALTVTMPGAAQRRLQACESAFQNAGHGRSSIDARQGCSSSAFRMLSPHGRRQSSLPEVIVRIKAAAHSTETALTLGQPSSGRPAASSVERVEPGSPKSFVAAQPSSPVANTTIFGANPRRRKQNTKLSQQRRQPKPNPAEDVAAQQPHQDLSRYLPILKHPKSGQGQSRLTG